MNDVFWLPHGAEPTLAIRYGDSEWPYVGDATEDRGILQLAHAFCEGRILANPLVLEGPSGSGKTLLARAWMQLAAPCLPGARWIRAHDFRRSYMQAQDTHTVPEWRTRLLNAPAVFLDAVHHLCADLAIQRVLESLLDEWIERGTAVIVTIHVDDGERVGMSRRLASRLAQALTVALELPGPQARHWLVKRFLAERGLAAGAEHIDQLCRWWQESVVTVNEMRSLIAELAMRSESLAQPSLSTAIAMLTANRSSSDVDISDITRLVARRYAVSLREIRGASRRRSTVHARAAAMWLARKWTELSYHRIGEYFHKRDHSTVMHACRSFEERLKRQPATRQVILALERELSTRSNGGMNVNGASTNDEKSQPIGSS